MRCELTELEEDGCGHCKAKLPRPVFTAQHRTTCPTCDGEIFQGDKCVWTLDGTAAEHARHAR